MLSKQPDQQLHDELIKRTNQLGLTAYPYLPKEGTSYPFMVVSYIQVNPYPTKTRLLGSVSAQVDVWGTIEDRRLVSDWIGRLMEEYSTIRYIDDHEWSMDLSSPTQIIKDDSTDEVLYHGILDLTFKFR